jgi:UrcA family protein
MFRFLILIAGAILALSASPAFASAPPQAVSRTVAYGDLDLSTPAGRLQLRHRAAVAVRDACEQAWATDLDAFAQSRHCRALLQARLMAHPTLGPIFGAPMRLR